MKLIAHTSYHASALTISIHVCPLASPNKTKATSLIHATPFLVPSYLVLPLNSIAPSPTVHFGYMNEGWLQDSLQFGLKNTTEVKEEITPSNDRFIPHFFAAKISTTRVIRVLCALKKK